MASVLERGTRVSKAVYGSDYMVEVLRELGIRYIALNPGASYRGLHDSIVNFGSGGPEILMCAHEEFAVAMANGYFRATGEVMATGLHNVVGLQHASMAIFNAWCDRSPVLNLGGGGPQDATHRRSTDWVHTALVQGDVVRDYIKFHDQPYSVSASAESLLRAYRIATTEPKGPVYICLDADIQEEHIDTPFDLPDARLFRAPAPPAADPGALREAADWLVNAEWPVIVPGEVGLHHKALPALRELAELLGAAVVDAGGPFNFPNTHPLDLTAAREEALKDADVVLALDVPSLGVPLGPSVREREALRLATKPDAKIIHITLHDMQDQSWVNDVMWLLPIALPISGSAARALPELVELCRAKLRDANKSRVVQRSERIGEIHRKAGQRAQDWLKQAWGQKPISAARFWGEMGSRLKQQPFALVHAHGARWRQVVELSEPGHGLGGGRGAGVGYGLPSSIGAALGYKDSGRLCVDVQGDGDFFMTSNALWTAAKYQIPLLTVIFNNRSYYNDEEHQERMAVRRERPVENKSIGIRIEEPNPDFAGLARSIGATGFGPVTDPNELGQVLDRAIEEVKSGGPVVVDVHTQNR